MKINHFTLFVSRTRRTNNITHLIGIRRSLGVNIIGSIYRLTDNTPPELRVFTEMDDNAILEYKNRPAWAIEWSNPNERNTGSATGSANGLWRTDHVLLPIQRIELYKFLNKHEAISILKLRSTHNNIGANLALRREAERDDANGIKYQCHMCNNEVIETLQHIVFECPAYVQERQDALNEFINHDINRILSDRNGVKAFATFISSRKSKPCSSEGCLKCKRV